MAETPIRQMCLSLVREYLVCALKYCRHAAVAIAVAVAVAATPSVATTCEKVFRSDANNV